MTWTLVLQNIVLMCVATFLMLVIRAAFNDKDKK